MDLNKNTLPEYQVDPCFLLRSSSSARMQYHPTNPFYDDIQRTFYEDRKNHYHEFTDNHVSNDTVFSIKQIKDDCTDTSKILTKDSLKNIEFYNTIQSAETFNETYACRPRNKLNKRSYSDSMQNLYPKTCQTRCVTCQRHYKDNVPTNCVSDISYVSQGKHKPVLTFKETNSNRKHKIDEAKQKSPFSSAPQKYYPLKNVIEEIKIRQKNVAWHNYINELKNKHGYPNESPVHITNEHTPDDESYLTTNTSKTHNRRHFSNSCKMLLRHFYEAYKEVFELTHEYMNADLQDLSFNSDGQLYNLFSNSLQCYPTSSQGRIIALERERNTKSRWQYSPDNNIKKHTNQHSIKISRSTNYEPIKNEDKFTIVTDQISSIYCSDQVNTEQNYCKWRSIDRQSNRRKKIVKFEFEDGDCYRGTYVTADKEHNNSCDLRKCGINNKDVSINCKIDYKYQSNETEDRDRVPCKIGKEGNYESTHQQILNFNDPAKLVKMNLKFKDNALQIPDISTRNVAPIWSNQLNTTVENCGDIFYLPKYTDTDNIKALDGEANDIEKYEQEISNHKTHFNNQFCNTNETIMSSQSCGYPNDNAQNTVLKSSSMQTLIVNPALLNKEDKAFDKRKILQDKYKNITNDVDKLTKRIQSTQNFIRHSALSNIEVKIGDLVKSINSFIKEIKTSKNQSSNKSTLINMTKTVSKRPNDLTKNITNTEKILCNILNNEGSSSELLSNCDLSKLDLFYDIDKNDQVTRDNDELECNKHDFALQIIYNNPTQERATVTESVFVEEIDRKNTVQIVSTMLNDNCVTIAVNTDPLGLLALLRVSSEALKGILSYIPNVNYQAYLPATRTTAAAGYVCNICEANFQRPLDLSEHILSHDLGNTSKRNCTACTHALDKWRRKPPRSFKCKYCELQFLRAYCCELHQQVCAKNFGVIHDISSNLMLLK